MPPAEEGLVLRIRVTHLAPVPASCVMCQLRHVTGVVVGLLALRMLFCCALVLGCFLLFV